MLIRYIIEQILPQLLSKVIKNLKTHILKNSEKRNRKTLQVLVQ